MESRKYSGQVETSLVLDRKRGWFAVTAAALLFRCLAGMGESPGRQILMAGVYGILLAIAICDQETRLIPNRLNLLVFVCGGADALIRTSPAIHLGDRVSGFLGMGAVLLLLSWASKRGIGGGDVKLMAAAGFLCGREAVIRAALLGFFLSGLYGAGLLISRRAGREDQFPLGPFLCLGIGWVLGS